MSAASFYFPRVIMLKQNRKFIKPIDNKDV